MFDIGEKIIYGENGVCTVEKIAPLDMTGASREKLYYYLTPLVGSGTYFAPVDTSAFMRPIISRDEADALIDSMPGIAPAICNDSGPPLPHGREEDPQQPRRGNHEAGEGYSSRGAVRCIGYLV